MAVILDLKEGQEDTLAEIVVDRYRRARDYRSSHIIYQGLSFQGLIERSDAQLRREYTPDDARRMQESFGFCPSRYYPLASFKCQAVTAWRMNLVASNLDGLFTIAPTPNPSLDQEAQDRIRDQVRQRLLDRMAQAGVIDPALLLDVKGQPAKRIERFLREQILDLKKVEEGLQLSSARSASERIAKYMRDVLVEGGYRQAYQLYATDAVTYGLGVMRFVPQARMPILSHRSSDKGGSNWKWGVRPQYRHVSTPDFYPIADSDSLQTNTGNTEYSRITKAELIGLAKNKNYNADVISDIVEEYNSRHRDWLDESDNPADVDAWELDETIPLLIHEGYFSGNELKEHGIDGVGILDYVTARVEVCGRRTIRATLQRLPNGLDRTFFAAPYNKIGPNVFDAIGLPAQLWDNEQRINTLLHLFEHNIDWSSRPPTLVNSSVFADPADAMEPIPGGAYEVQERFGANGVMPEPMRSMHTVSAQYHLIMTQINAIIRDADEITGLPGYALGGAQGLGASSLGEYSQRISNSLRIIQQVLLNEDMFFIEPAMTSLFHHVVKENKELLRGADVQVVVRGSTGLMQQDTSAQRMQSALGLILGDQTGLVEPQIKQYAIRQVYEQAGIPADALGATDPLIEQALAEAATAPAGTFGPMSPQVPALDARSGAAFSSGVLASPSGQPAAAIPPPSTE